MRLDKFLNLIDKGHTSADCTVIIQHRNFSIIKMGLSSLMEWQVHHYQINSRVDCSQYEVMSFYGDKCKIVVHIKERMDTVVNTNLIRMNLKMLENQNDSIIENAFVTDGIKYYLHIKTMYGDMIKKCLKFHMTKELVLYLRDAKTAQEKLKDLYDSSKKDIFRNGKWAGQVKREVSAQYTATLF